MSLPKVAITRRVFPQALDRFAGVAQVNDNQTDIALSDEQIVGLSEGCCALIVTANCQVSASLLQRLTHIKLIANIGVGYNNIDVHAAKSLGIMVTNTPDVLTEATADMAWALMMAAGRRISAAEHWLRDGQWRRWSLDLWLGADYYGSTLGIIGMGRIGQAIARRAQGFGMQVIYHNRQPLAHSTARWVSKTELLKTADHVIVVVPYTPQTHHLIRAQDLALMKPTAVLVNIARGGVVDDEALAQALSNGVIAAAGIDVFEGEPQVHPALLAAPNTVLTPHIGSATLQSRLGMANLAIDNVLDYLAGQAPRTLV